MSNGIRKVALTSPRRDAMPRSSFAIIAILAVALGACRADSPEGDGGSSGAAVDAEAVALGATLWQARGHQIVALELLSAGDEAAAVHAAHPIEEVLASVEGEVEERGGDAAVLRGAFEEFQSAVTSGGDAQTAADAANAAIEEAESAVAEDPADPAYRGSVIAALLSTAAHEYEESIQDGQVSETVEYQDAFGFVRAARELYEDIASAVEEASSEEAEEIDEAFGELEAALAEPQPPATPVAAEDIEKAAALIGHELEETVGAQPAESADPEEVFARIDTLLGQILAEYEEGEAEEASELAAEAYLENYEVVEADVIRLAPEVNAELEPLLAAELRAAMEDGVPVEELEGLVERARELLAEAEEAVLED
jgi:hypothetical protein